MDTRPCFNSAARYHLRVESSLPLERPTGSNRPPSWGAAAPPRSSTPIFSLLKMEQHIDNAETNIIYIFIRLINNQHRRTQIFRNMQMKGLIPKTQTIYQNRTIDCFTYEVGIRRPAVEKAAALTKEAIKASRRNILYIGGSNNKSMDCYKNKQNKRRWKVWSTLKDFLNDKIPVKLRQILAYFVVRFVENDILIRRN